MRFHDYSLKFFTRVALCAFALVYGWPASGAGEENSVSSQRTCLEDNHEKWVALEKEYRQALEAGDFETLKQLREKKKNLKRYVSEGCGSDSTGSLSPGDSSVGNPPNQPEPPSPSLPGGESAEKPVDQDCSICGKSPEQACYSCKDGKCANHCNVTQAGLKRSIETSTEWGDMKKMLTRGINRIPYARVTLDDSFSGSQEVGQECCKKCTSSTSEPRPYLKTSGNGKLEAKITVVIPGTGGLGDFDETIFSSLGTTIKVVGSYTIGVFIEGTGSAGATIEFKQTDCPLDNNCFAGSIGMAGPLTGGVTGRVSGGYEILEDGQKERHVQGGKLEGRIVTGYSINGVVTSGGTCGPSKCEMGHDGIKVEAEVSFEVDLGYFKESVGFTIGHTFVEPDKKPC